MPQVPGLVPDVQPQGQIPGVSINTPEAAFGGAVAHALSQLGTTMEQSGGQIWQRAMEMQELRNRAEVDRADAEFMKQAGMEHAKFGAMEGQQAAAYFPTYMDNLSKIRENIRGGMSNPMSAKMFDTTSLSTLGRTIFNGAGHAATQEHIEAKKAINSRIAEKVDQSTQTDDPAQQAQIKEEVRNLNIVRGGIEGEDPATTKQNEKIINSSLTFHKLKHEGSTDPWKVWDKFQEARKAGELTQKDSDTLNDFLIGKMHAIGGVNIATEVLNANKDADGKPVKSYDELEAQVIARAKELRPGDDVMVKHAQDALRGEWRLKRYADAQFKRDNVEAIDEKIVQGVSNLQELLADPKASAAYFNLSDSEKLRVAGRINNYNAARDKADQERSERIIKGIQLNDPKGFQELDPTDPKWGLSQKQQGMFFDRQRQSRKTPANDIGTARAMSWMRDAKASEMEALGIYRRTAKNADDYDHVTGMMYEALDIWREAHGGKQPGPKDVINDIAPQILQTHAHPTWFGLSHEDVGAYRQEVPDKFATAYKEQVNPKAKNEEIYRSYLRKVLMDNYQKATQGATESK